jgi:hypothetical protein
MGYNDAEKNLKEKNAADATEKTAKNERDSQRNLAILYRTYAGHPPADKKELSVAYDEYVKLAGKGEDKDGNVKALQDLEKSLGWNKANGMPNSDMLKEKANLEKKNKEFQDVIAQKEVEVKNRETEAKRAREQRDAFEVEYKKELEKLNAKANADQKKWEDMTQKQVLSFGDSGKIIEEQKDKIASNEATYNKTLKARDKEIKDLHTQLDKLQEKRPKLNAMTLDQPKGKIVLMDKTGGLPYINLGRDDRVRPQLTFSIHALGTDGRPLKESKGSLEVVNVSGEHLSQARIISQVDAIHDPVASGDVLMNAAWDPNEQRHVAIAGLVDLTGGTIDPDRPADIDRALNEFKRSLESQGLVVDAWLDFVNNGIEGKGISRATDYLIIGDIPSTKAGIIKADDPKAKRRDDQVKLATKMQEDATKAGVAIVKLRDFLAMTGYRMPRSKEEDNLGKIHKTLSTVGSPVDKSYAKPKAGSETKSPEK